MTIEIKYNIGDEVWMIRNNEVQKHEIRSVTINKTPTTFMIYYSFADMFDLDECRGSEFSTDIGLEWWSEDKLFHTKEELLKSL